MCWCTVCVIVFLSVHFHFAILHGRVGGLREGGARKRGFKKLV